MTNSLSVCVVYTAYTEPDINLYLTDECKNKNLELV